jgi:transitional endoplasmic reticulum ATPase
VAKLTKQDLALLDALQQLGGNRMQDDALVYEGDKFVIPEHYEGKPMMRVIEFLDDYEEQRSQRFNVDRRFDYHPYDVANAFEQVLKMVFGTAGFGKVIKSFFGDIKPEYRVVRTGPDTTVQVPWNKFNLPIIEADLYIGSQNNRDDLPVGFIRTEVPRRNRGIIEGLYKAIEEHLRQSSLFRGRAFDANWMDPEFIDLTTVDPNKVVFNSDTERQIEANIWSVIRNAKRIVSLGMPLKRAVLLEGPYGTGKTLTGVLTAQVATANGWTFIHVKPRQDINQALQSARLLAPAVVFFEDLDIIAQPGEDDVVSQLLDTFDGISSKSNPVVAVLTTNHVQRLHKGMLRPGRLDSVIHVGEHDHDARIKLVQTLAPEGSLDANIEWDRVSESMEGYLPAFIREAVDRAIRYAVSRTTSNAELAINTEDLVDAAKGLRPQLDLMTGAAEKVERDKMADLLAEAAAQGTMRVVDGTKLVYEDGSPEGLQLAVPKNGN